MDKKGRSRNVKDRQYNGQKRNKKTNNSGHRKLKISQHKSH